jgi:hypothetical protein
MTDLMQSRTLCTARRRNGEPCQNAPMKGSTVCRMHGGAAPQVRRRAQQRLLEASDLAAAKLVTMMQDKTLPPAVQLAAARDLLDRAGVASPDELVVSLGSARPSWDDVMEGVLVDVDPGDSRIVHTGWPVEEVLDAEVLDGVPARATSEMHVQPTPSPHAAETEKRRQREEQAAANAEYERKLLARMDERPKRRRRPRS